MKWLLAFALACCTSAASAGTIHYLFYPYFEAQGPITHYYVAVSVSGADTSGLAGFGFSITGLAAGTSSQVAFAPVPLRTFDNNFVRHGFGQLAIGIPATDTRTFSATQLNQPAPLYGIGLRRVVFFGGDIPMLPNEFTPDLFFDSIAILGTLSTPMQLTRDNIEVGGTLFTTAQDGGVLAVADTVSTFAIAPYPSEPSSLILGGLAVAGIVGCVRRHRTA